MLIYNEVFTSLVGGYMPVLMIIFLLFGVLTGYLTRGGKRSRILGMAIPAGIFVLAELMYFLNLQIFSSGDGFRIRNNELLTECGSNLKSNVHLMNTQKFTRYL